MYVCVCACACAVVTVSVSPSAALLAEPGAQQSDMSGYPLSSRDLPVSTCLGGCRCAVFSVLLGIGLVFMLVEKCALLAELSPLPLC